MTFTVLSTVFNILLTSQHLLGRTSQMFITSQIFCLTQPGTLEREGLSIRIISI